LWSTTGPGGGGATGSSITSTGTPGNSGLDQLAAAEDPGVQFPFQVLYSVTVTMAALAILSLPTHHPAARPLQLECAWV
jgi:hypothetical protein